VILAVGLVLANVAWRIVLLAAVNAGWPSARLVGGAVHFLMVTTAAAMALDQVGLARPIVLAAFAIAFGALMLALAIALSTAAGPIVRRLLEERLAARDRPRPDGSSHL
jgi:small-conductance mechanosensitive channel